MCVCVCVCGWKAMNGAQAEARGKGGKRRSGWNKMVEDKMKQVNPNHTSQEKPTTTKGSKCCWWVLFLCFVHCTIHNNEKHASWLWLCVVVCGSVWSFCVEFVCGIPEQKHKPKPDVKTNTKPVVRVFVMNPTSLEVLVRLSRTHAQSAHNPTEIHTHTTQARARASPCPAKAVHACVRA